MTGVAYVAQGDGCLVVEAATTAEAKSRAACIAAGKPFAQIEAEGNPRSDLTRKQSAVFDFVRAYLVMHGYPPTVSDICRALGLASKSTAHQHLHALKRKGYIEIDPGPRALRVVR